MPAARPVLLLVLLTALLAPARDAPADDPESENPVPRLRMVHLTDGLRSIAPRGDLGRLAETRVFQVARETGLDLRRTPEPLLVHRHEHRRLFYLFFKTVEGAIGDRPYLIQRVRKTLRTWKTAESEPEVEVQHLVEAYRLLGGALVKPDQHFGSFALRDAYKREVVKEYEIGFGELPGICEGTTWPFGSNQASRVLQRFSPASGHHDDVAFTASKHFTLRIVFDKTGAYSVSCDALGFDAPETPPRKPEAERDPTTRDLVLTAGVGVNKLEVGLSFERDIRGALGLPLVVDRFSGGTANYVTPRALVVNVDATRTVNTVFTRRAFAGRTSRGIGLGDTRAKVMEVHGVPVRQQTDGPYWTYPGIVFHFDGWHEVSGIVIRRIPE